MFTMREDFEILDIIRREDRILHADIMDDKTKKDIVKLELKRLDEMIPLINKGLEEAFSLDYAIMVVKDKTGIVLPDEELIPTLTLQTEDGTIIGEEIYDPEELEDLREDPDAYFVSEHFVTYPNLSIGGQKQFFVVSQLYNEFECEDELRKSVSKLALAAPSTEADHYIKDIYNLDHESRITTIIIGFNE